MRRQLIWLVWLAATACTSGNYAPVYDYSSESRTGRGGGEPVTRGVHVVRSGDTLYSIAWRYGWDHRELARANGIDPPYTIYPGQEIDLGADAGKSSPARETARKTEKQPDTGTASKPKPKPRPSTSSGKTPEKTGPLEWRWPAEGELVGRFSSGSVGQRGIVIAGNEGAPVRAAEAGVVVYRGNGLTGYGNLLIIKHNHRWLSAYAHNERMLVEEGRSVEAGEKIATMGASGTYRTQLHFEVRRDGEPVDPLPLLPKQ